MPPPMPVAPPYEPIEDVDDYIDADPVLDERYDHAKRIAIAGGVTMGVGLIMSMSAGFSLALESTYTDVTPPNVPAEFVAEWAMLGVGLTALVAGSVVLGIGLGKRKSVIDDAEAQMGSQAFVAPWFGKRGGGLGLTLRY